MRADLRLRHRNALLLSGLIAAAVLTGPDSPVLAQAEALRWDGLIELISGRYDYPPPTSMPPNPADGPSQMSRRAVSADGRYIVFTANAPSLGYYDTALYLRDRRAGELRLLVPAASVAEAAISGDGNHVAFRMCEPYMRPDNAPICDVWAFDVRTWGMTALSATPYNGHGDADSGGPVLSHDGRFVVFHTKAQNLGLPNPDGVQQLVLRDRDPDQDGLFDEPDATTLEIVSAPDGAPATSGGDGPSETAEVSDDGRYVAFRSAASNLVTGTAPGWDVFRRDRQTFETRQLNVRSVDQPSPWTIDSPAISMSADGRFVAFSSADPILVPMPYGDFNNDLDIFIYDALAPSASRLSRVDIGRDFPNLEVYVAGNGPSSWPSLSADGRYVAFQTASTNIDAPPPSGFTYSYVFDRVAGTPTLVSVKPDGTDPDESCLRPEISADGTLVAFMSGALNLAPNVSTPFERIYAAVHFEVAPPEIAVAGGPGGTGTYTITTQQHTQWWIDWSVMWPPWVYVDSGWFGIGSGTTTVRANEANPDPTPRSATLRFFEKTVQFTQLEGLSLTSISPAEGPDTGGTQVTLTGTGFEPGMRVMFDGSDVAIESMTSTTIVATTPPHAPGSVFVAVFAPAPDFRAAWLDNGFRYTDTSPPLVWNGLGGTEGDAGWFRSDVQVNWAVWDPETPVTSTSGCEYTTITTDTAGTVLTCTATSEGGTSSSSVTVKRDTAFPTVAITTPGNGQIYERGASVLSAFTCADALSGVAACGASAPAGTPIDTSTSGRFSFWADARDVAGNFGYASTEYAVSTGVCAPPAEGLRTWMRFDGDLTDVMSTAGSLNPGMPPDTYVAGKSGQAYRFVSRGGQALEHWHDGRANFGSAMSVAMWLNPANTSLGSLVRNKDQYRIERTGAGAINWMLFHPDTGPSFGTSNPKAPQGVWTHVVFTYDAGEVKVYFNGQLDRTWNWSSASLRGSTWNRIRIGGEDEFFSGWPYVGAFDELQLFNRALSASEVEAIFFAGASGVCAPAPITLEVPSPIQTTFGAETYRATAVLRDASGAPLAGKPIRLYQNVSDSAGDPRPTTTMVTDAEGTVRWDAAFDVAAGTYPSGFTAFFEGDLQYAHSPWVTATVVVQKAMPQITWATPAPIMYGTALSYFTQLNATASIPGSFSYNPGDGAVLGAGTRTLNVTFMPSNYQNYQTASASVTLEVGQATPTLNITGGTFTYDAQPHGATAAATDYLGRPLTPVTIAYDGSADPPVNAGTYTAMASYAGDANHLPHSASATITIAKATPFIMLPSPTTFTYDGQPHGVTANVYGAGATLLGQASITYNGSPNPPVEAGTYSTVASFAGNDNYTERSLTFNVRINQATPTVSVSGGPFTYDRQPHAATVTVTGVGGQDLGAATVLYNNAPDLPVNAGTYAVTASFAGSSNYASASGSGTLIITKATPVVTVPDSTFTYGNGPFLSPGTVTGVGGEVLGPLGFTYNGTFSLPFTPGIYNVVASYAGSANYTAATGTGTLTVRKAAPIFVVASATVTYDGQPHPAGVILAGVYGEVLGPYAVTYNGSPDPPVNAGTYAVEATYDGADYYEAATATGTKTIVPAAVALTVTGGTFTYDAQPHPATVSATGVGGEPLSPVLVTYNGAAAPPVNGGTYAVSATFPGSANYAAATDTATIRIDPTWPTVSITGGEFVYDGQPHPATATATGVPGEVLSPINLTYWRTGFGAFEVPIEVGTYEATATFPGSANYFPKSAATTVVIGRAMPTVSVTGGSFTYDGQPHPATATVTGVGGVALGPLSVTYNGSLQPPVNAGSYAVVATYIGNASYQPASGTATITIGKAVPVLNWNPPAGITYGTPLGAGQLNATANVAGTFVYSPAAGAVLPAAPAQALTATFTPADTTNYNSGSIGQSIAVSPAPLAIRANDASKPFGAPLPAFTASAIGFVNGDSIASLVGTLGFSTTATAQSAVGTYPIVPSGVAGANYTIAFVPGALTIVKGAVAVSVATTPAPSGLDQPMTFTASVSAAAPAAGDPTGTVRFFDGTTLLGSTSLSSGSTSLTTAGLSAGVHTIEARYDGDASFETGTGSSSHTVNAANATPVITISSNRNPSSVGQSVTLTANISMASGSVAGTLVFYDGATLIGSGTIASGRVTYTTTGFAAGSHAITVRYLGGASAPPVRSGVFVQAVGASGWKNRSTSVSLTASPNPSALGDGVTLTASVTGSTSSMPTGTMVVMVNGEVAGAVAVSPVSGSTARATLALSDLAGGRHKVTATYLGDSTYRGSTNAVTQTVN